MKVLRPAARASWLTMRVSRRSASPTVAEAAGTKLPTCARYTTSPTCRARHHSGRLEAVSHPPQQQVPCPYHPMHADHRA
jgi:hypothetical protein